MSISIDNHIIRYQSKTVNMIIKIDCRERELMELLKPATTESAPASEPEPASAPEPDLILWISAME